jgi:hypothetical protein
VSDETNEKPGGFMAGTMCEQQGFYACEGCGTQVGMPKGREFKECGNCHAPGPYRLARATR